jgi:hypothetical protein
MTPHVMITMLNTRWLAFIPRLAAGWPLGRGPLLPRIPGYWLASGWRPDAPRTQS